MSGEDLQDTKSNQQNKTHGDAQLQARPGPPGRAALKHASWGTTTQGGTAEPQKPPPTL